MYCTVDDVKDYTGGKEEDFNFVNPGQFDQKVEGWIAQADAIINRSRRRTFDPIEADVQYADLLKSLSTRITMRIMAEAKQSRTSSIEKIDDYTMRMIDNKILSPDILAELDLLPAGVNFAMSVTSHRRHHHHHHEDDDDDD